jgi:hypothetical protein
MNKEEFIRRIALIQNFHSEQETLRILIGKLTDGYPIVDFGNYLAAEIISMINEVMDIKDTDLIDWWLYEDVEKIIYDNEENEIAHLRTAGDLYDYIVGDK